MTRHRTKVGGKPSPNRRALDAVRHMRRGLSLWRAAKIAHTSVRTIRKYAGSALRDVAGGGNRPRRSDQLVRELRFLTPTGQIAVRTRSAKVASDIGRYFNAVDKALRTGNERYLAGFKGRTVRHGRKRVPFVTDMGILSRLAHVGEVSFLDLYATSA